MEGGGQEVERDGGRGDTRHLTQQDLKSVEKELSDLARTVAEEWFARQTQTSLEEAAYRAFGKEFDWGGDKVVVEEEGVRAVVGVGNLRVMTELLNDVVFELSEVQQVKFEVNLMLEGYSSYLKFRAKEVASMMVGDHELYESWHKVGMVGMVASVVVVWWWCGGGVWVWW